MTGNTTATKANSIVRKLMLKSWNESIFAELKECLLRTALKPIHIEKNCECFDSNLITELPTAPKLQEFTPEVVS